MHIKIKLVVLRTIATAKIIPQEKEYFMRQCVYKRYTKTNFYKDILVRIFYIFIYIYTHTCIYIYIYTHTHTYVNVYIYISLCDLSQIPYNYTVEVTNRFKR